MSTRGFVKPTMAADHIYGKHSAHIWFFTTIFDSRSKLYNDRRSNFFVSSAKKSSNLKLLIFDSKFINLLDYGE